MSVFGNKAPKFDLLYLDTNNAATNKVSVTCPVPQRRDHDYKEEHKIIKNYQGKIIRQENRYRFWTRLRFVNLDENNFNDLLMVANWDEVIHYYPSSDVTYFMEEVKVISFHPFHVNDKVHYDGLEIELQGINAKPKISTPDTLLLGMLRTSVQ